MKPIRTRSFKFSVVYLLSFFPLSLFAELSPSVSSNARPYVAPIHFELGYTLGTHEGEFSVVQSKLSAGKDEKLKGTIWVNLNDVQIKNSKLKCHFWESMGIDYTQSNYPNEHVCDEKNQLPEKGANSLKYSEIRFEILDSKKLGPDQMELMGHWKIHGIEKRTSLITSFRQDGNTLSLYGQTNLKLTDFGIVVKKFLFVSVADEAKINWNVTLRLSQN